ncbi:uncharacterized protein M6B38_322630 [Iris pallida]|uniref:Uncharacterized protein n=1 Tax=Iris pallida TaxID=29817 RepID=A0AAX6HAP4_IRIPA|nr:uncharacterized protein M6B38_322630 [Iris pallida]
MRSGGWRRVGVERKVAKVAPGEAGTAGCSWWRSGGERRGGSAGAQIWRRRRGLPRRRHSSHTAVATQVLTLNLYSPSELCGGGTAWL